MPAASPYSKRLPHVVNRAELCRLLTPTYATAHRVDDEVAEERLAQALGNPALVDDLYFGLWEALCEKRTARSSEDALIDRLSLAIEGRGRAKEAPSSPAISAVLVRIDVEAGEAPETLRATLATEKGLALYHQGLRDLGAHLVRDLLRSGGSKRQGS